MRRMGLIVLCCSTGLAFGACSRGNGSRDTGPMQRVVTVSGCLTQANGATVLVVSGRQGAGSPVGTSGSSPERYRLIDEAHADVDRYVGREAQVTGKLELAGQYTDANGPETTKDVKKQNDVPAIRVTQMTSGAECSAR